MNNINLKSGDIELKTLSVNQVEVFYTLLKKNKDQVGKWLVWVDRINAVEDVEQLIEEFNQRNKKGEGMNFGIWKESTLIGYISFAHIDKNNSIARLAYWLDSDCQGKGIISKSCVMLIDYGFNRLNLNMIEIHCADGNEKSRAIPERLGFTKERIIKNSELIRGGSLVDNYVYVISKQEWK